MKLHEIRKEYGLNQTTFYGWLRELGAIRKADTGYVVGDNHFDGMENLVTRRVNENGEFIERTQVKIDNQKFLIYWKSISSLACLSCILLQKWLKRVSV